MKALATFDGSKFSEATLPTLEWIARAPDAEFVLLAVGEEPSGVPSSGRAPLRRAASTLAAQGGRVMHLEAVATPPAETKDQAVQRKLAELRDYLAEIAVRLPERTRVRIEAHINDDPAAAIIARAIEEQPDVIVMATHGRTGLVHAIFGDTAEQVVRAGVAPVLLVNPDRARRTEAARGATTG